jgi:hypothetical protein
MMALLRWLLAKPSTFLLTRWTALINLTWMRFETKQDKFSFSV